MEIYNGLYTSVPCLCAHKCEKSYFHNYRFDLRIHIIVSKNFMELYGEKMRKQVAMQVDTIYWNVVCDLCGVKDLTATPEHSFLKCRCCKRDMCNRCQRRDYYWSDDKPEMYCIDCHENGKHFRELRDIEDERHGEALEDIQKRWYINARQYVKDKEKEKDV